MKKEKKNGKNYYHIESIDEAEVICENIEDLTEEEWLALRKTVGGSDEGPLFGCGFKTILDTWLDKTGQVKNIKKALEDRIALEVGHRLEGLVIDLCKEQNPGFEFFFDRRMLKHPNYPIHADCDGFARNKETGELWVVEAKTTNENSLYNNWGGPDDDLIPEAYMWQGRHYMAITGAVGVIYCCLGGNNKQGYRQRFLRRDLEQEKILFDKVEEFWKLVETNTPPDIDSEDGGKLLDTLIERYGNKEHKEAKDMTESLVDIVANYNDIKAKRLELDKQSRELKKAESSALADIIAVLGSDNGYVEIGDDTYNLTWKHKTTRSFPSKVVAALLETFPGTEEYLDIKESDSLEVKKAKKK